MQINGLAIGMGDIVINGFEIGICPLINDTIIMTGNDNGKDLITITTQGFTFLEIFTQQIGDAFDNNITGAQSDLFLDSLKLIQHQVKHFSITVAFCRLEYGFFQFIDKTFTVIEAGQQIVIPQQFDL